VDCLAHAHTTAARKNRREMTSLVSRQAKAWKCQTRYNARRHVFVVTTLTGSLFGATACPTMAAHLASRSVTHSVQLGRHAKRHSGRHHRSVRHPLAHAAIVGGTPAEAGTFPWLAAIFYEANGEAFMCTGTVVASNLILTAAHCAENSKTGVVRQPSGYLVVTGNVNWRARASEKQISTVSRVIVDPYYERIGLLEGWEDAGLLALSAPIAQPAIPLATSKDSELWSPGTAAVIAGWGSTYYEEVSLTEVLQWATTVVQETEWCRNNAPGFHPLDNLCTIDAPYFETGACEGDSGGPLLALRPGTHEIVEIGITRGGYGLCSTTQPDVFTDAYQVSGWVNSWIRALKPPPPPSRVPAPPPPRPAAQQPPTPVAVWAPPNGPGAYFATGPRRFRISFRVAGDGAHLVLLKIKARISCKHGYSYDLDDSWLSYRENETIRDHIVQTTLETPADRYMKRGLVAVYMRFAGSNTVEGHVRVSVRSRNRRAGLCYARSIKFSARRSS
jgi:hypothetical protein